VLRHLGRTGRLAAEHAMVEIKQGRERTLAQMNLKSNNESATMLYAQHGDLGLPSRFAVPLALGVILFLKI